MSTNFPSGLRNRGVPIHGGGGGNPFLAMWGEDTYYVDYDNGSDSNAGTSPSTAWQYLDKAISETGANDVIYVRPRAPNTTGFDPNYMIPGATATGAGTANLTIPSTSHGLAIIGTGYGRGQGSQFYTYIRGTATATATSTLNVKAPWTLLENLSFHDGASTASCCVDLNGLASASGGVTGDGTSAYACGNTISNCMMRFSSGTALTISSVMWATILDCTFHKGAGISINSAEQVPDGIEIGNCNFIATASQVSVDITIADCDFINIHDCIFTHAQPSGGTNYYLTLATTVTGCASNCYFGVADSAAEVVFPGTIVGGAGSGITPAGCYCADGLMGGA